MAIVSNYNHIMALNNSIYVIYSLIQFIFVFHGTQKFLKSNNKKNSNHFSDPLNKLQCYILLD